MSQYNLTIYGFVEDTFLQRKPRIIINNEDDQGVGKLNSLLIDYFSSVVRLRDLRSARHNFIGFTPVGQMDLLFDNMIVDYPELWEKVNNNQLTELFTILDYVIYTNETQAPVLNGTLQDVTTHGTYVDSSVLRSMELTPCLVANDTGYDTIYIPKWFQFKVSWMIDSDEYVVHFKLYIDRATFATDYPIVTITKVTPPFNPEYFFNKFNSDDILSNIVEAHQYNASGTHEILKTVDQSGMYLFYVRYRVDQARYAYVPFEIFYKGASKPKDINCRVAVKDYLTNLGLVEDSVLKDYFPDLYLENSFYLVPMWDDFIIRPTRNVYGSISNVFHQIWSRFNNIITTTQSNFLSKCQLLLNGQNNMFTVVYANPLNTDVDITLKDIYPTFVDYSTQEINFEYMDAKDRNFALLLNKAFAVLTGEIPMDAGYKYYTEDDREYLVFSTDVTEILILTPTSYNALQS